MSAPKDGYISINLENDTRWFNYSDADSSVFMGIQSGFVADGEGYTQFVPNNSIADFPWLWGTLKFNEPNSLCQGDLGHWHAMIMDPSLGALFTEPNGPANPASPSNSVGIGVGVSLGLVAAIVITGVLLRLFYEPCKAGSSKKNPLKAAAMAR